MKRETKIEWVLIGFGFVMAFVMLAVSVVVAVTTLRWMGISI